MIGLIKVPCEESPASQVPAANPCAKQNQPWVLAATILGSSMAFIDGSVVGVAMPVMQKAFSASATEMEWVNNAYLLFLGSLVLLGGSLGDRIGRKKIFVIGIAIFTAASVACGLSPSVMVLIMARAIQGIGASLLVPSSLAILGATFTEESRGRAIGTWAAASAVVAALAPMFGGFLVDSASWRAIFWINVPVAVLAIAITLRYMPENKDASSHGKLDILGASLAALGLGAIAYGLTPDPYHAASFATGIVAIALFLHREARAANPLVPFSLFRDRTFTGTNLITFLLYFALGGALFFIPFYLIQVKGFTAAEAGAAFLPFTLLMGGFSRLMGGLAAKIGARLPLIIGPLTTAVGFAICSFVSPATSFWTVLFPGILVIGAGMTMSVSPLTNAVMGSVPPANVGIASGVNNAVARVAGLMAVAVLGALVLHVFSLHLDGWLNSRSVTLADSIRPQLAKLAAISLPPGLDFSETHSAHQAVQSAFVAAFREALLVCSACAAGASIFALALLPKEQRPRKFNPSETE